jgi:elongation factor G
MDKLGADFYMSVESIKSRITDKGVVLQLPVGQADEFKAIIDLLTMKMYTFSGDKGIEVHEHEIPDDMLEKSKKYREEMIDKVSMFDDELAEKFLAGEEPSIELIKKAIRHGTIHNNLYPILCGSALGNK